MVNCLPPFLSLPSLCFKWEGEGEKMNPSAQNDPSDLFLRLITLLRMCAVRAMSVVEQTSPRAKFAFTSQLT